MTPARIETEQLRGVHRLLARELRERLLAAEVEAVGLAFLHRADPTARLADDLADCRARCKRLRRSLAWEFSCLACLGLKGWAREQKRWLLRDVYAARCQAWAVVAGVREDHLAGLGRRARIQAEMSVN